MAALALLLKHAVQRKLKQAGMDLSAEAALAALATVQLADLELPDGGAKRLVTRGTRRAQQVLRALGIRDRMLPGGPGLKPRMKWHARNPAPLFSITYRYFWRTWARGEFVENQRRITFPGGRPGQAGVQTLPH